MTINENKVEHSSININPLDLQAVIEYLKEIDKPFIPYLYNIYLKQNSENQNVVLKKYVSRLNLAAYRNYTFNDSIHFIEHNDINCINTAKGYAFDSLVFRFKDYQSKAFQSEVNDYKYLYNCSEIEARTKIQNRHNKDLTRFIEILDNVIGEHD